MSLIGTGTLPGPSNGSTDQLLFGPQTWLIPEFITRWFGRLTRCESLGGSHVKHVKPGTVVTLPSWFYSIAGRNPLPSESHERLIHDCKQTNKQLGYYNVWQNLQSWVARLGFVSFAGEGLNDCFTEKGLLIERQIESL